MLIYSSTISSFIKKIQKRAFEIMRDEMGLQTKSKKFLFGQHFYPLNIVVFETENKWGYFWPEFFQLGIHRRFVTWPDQKVIDDLLRHELAHYLCFLTYGNQIDAHGSEYRDYCKSLGWSESVYRAKGSLSSDQQTETEMNEREKLMSKVQKLFRLAEGQTGHEAESAIAMANQMLLKYNLQGLGLSEQEEDVCCQKVLLFKKRSAKTDAILSILNHFYVATIYSQGSGLSSLEVVGNRSSVELADYTAKYLDLELERLWKLAKKQNPTKLKGLRARHSFFHGLAEGYIEKIKQGITQDEVSSRTVLKLENELKEKVALVYGRLSSLSVKRKGDQQAMNEGVNRGRELSLRPGVNKKKGSKLLEYFR